MDPQTVFCPNLDGPARGQVGKGNIHVQSVKERRYLCDVCHKTFAETKGTFFDRLQIDPAEVTRVVTLLAHGCPLQASVVAIEPKVGETVVVGTPLVRVADTSNFQAETTDLTEINVVNFQEGNTATITLDAIPDLELTGKAAHIKGFGENKQGDIVYTVVVKLDKQDPRLRWNMTAKVSITE
jgi:hypothetical protein